VNNGEGDASRTAEENRIKFHRLVKEVSDMIRSQGMKARAERTRQGGPNMRPLEKFERKVMAAIKERQNRRGLPACTLRSADWREKVSSPPSTSGQPKPRRPKSFSRLPKKANAFSLKQ